MIKKISIADKETLDIVNASVNDNKNTLSNMDTSMNNLNAKVDDLNSNVDEIKKISNSGIGCVTTLANKGSVGVNQEVLNITGAGVITCIASSSYSSSGSITSETISLQIDGAEKKYLRIAAAGGVTLSIRFNKSIIINASTGNVIVSYELFE